MIVFDSYVLSQMTDVVDRLFLLDHRVIIPQKSYHQIIHEGCTAQLFFSFFLVLILYYCKLLYNTYKNLHSTKYCICHDTVCTVYTVAYLTRRFRSPDYYY